MSIVTLEGTVEKGQIRLPSDLRLPDKTKVYVVIPGIQVENLAYVFSPRLADPSQAIDFKLEVLEDTPNATL
jgi:hypothetical protein